MNGGKKTVIKNDYGENEIIKRVNNTNKQYLNTENYIKEEDSEDN